MSLWGQGSGKIYPWRSCLYHGHPLPLLTFHSSKRTDCQISVFTYSLEKWRRSLPPPVAHHEWNPRSAAAGASWPSYPRQDEGREAPHYCPTGLGKWVSTDDYRVLEGAWKWVNLDTLLPLGGITHRFPILPISAFVWTISDGAQSHILWIWCEH